MATNYTYFPNVAPRETRAQAVQYLKLLVDFSIADGQSAGWTGDPLDDPHAVAIVPCPNCDALAGVKADLFLAPQDNGGIKPECFQCTPGGVGIRRLTKACADADIQLSRRPSRNRGSADTQGDESAGQEHDQDGDFSSLRLPFFQMGEWFARRYFQDTLRIVRNSNGIARWWYERPIWRVLSEAENPGLVELARNGDAIAEEMRKYGQPYWCRLLRQEKFWTKLRAAGSDFWLGFYEALATKDAPDSPLYFIGTPDGVVDLRTGEMMEHSPDYGVRAVTAARYRPDSTSLGKTKDAFVQRFHKVLSVENGEAFLQLLGLALTRTAPNRRGWVAVLGDSGSGKGGMLTVIKQALGDYALALPRKWVQGKSGGDDIDTVAADVIQLKPAVLLVDEAAMAGVDPQVLFSLTGGTEHTGRRPHGPRVYGPAMGQLWTTSVTPPSAPRHEGAERRVAILPTLGIRLEESNDIEDAVDPDCLDYVLTRAIQEAAAVYQSPYAAPIGDREARETALADMDPLADFLSELREGWEGQPVTALREYAQEQLGRKFTSQGFGRKVNAHPRWEAYRDQGKSTLRLKCSKLL